MAERRMFAKTIIDSDAFLEMPATSQLLYFHLSMRADDEGFVNKPKSIMRTVGCKDDDLSVLCAKGFIIPFESGVVVIKHWYIHNWIRTDRKHETKYFEEREKLVVKENGAYSANPQCLTDGCQMSDTWDTEVRLGKDRLGEDSKENASAPRHFVGQHGYVKLTDEEHARLIKDLGQSEAERVIAYVDESAAYTGNKNKWKDWNLVLRKASREGWGARSKKPKPTDTFEFDENGRLK